MSVVWTEHPAVVSFFTEADTAFRNGDYPALIKLCGATPSWEERAMASPNSAKRKPAKKRTKKKVEETALKAVRMEHWDEEAVALIHQRLCMMRATARST